MCLTFPFESLLVAPKQSQCGLLIVMANRVKKNNHQVLVITHSSYVVIGKYRMNIFQVHPFNSSNFIQCVLRNKTEEEASSVLFKNIYSVWKIHLKILKMSSEGNISNTFAGAECFFHFFLWIDYLLPADRPVSSKRLENN